MVYRLILIPAAVLGTMIAVTIGVVLGLRHAPEETQADGPEQAAPAGQLRQTLESSIKLTGTLNPQRCEERQEGGKAWSYLRWRIELSFANDTPWPLDLGKDFLLYEANDDLSRIDGVALLRRYEPNLTPPAHLMPISATEPYGLANNFQIHFATGEYAMRRGNRLLNPDGRECLVEDGKLVAVRREPPRFGPADEDPRIGFGRVNSRKTRQLSLYLEQGSWLGDKERDRVEVVLPEIVVADQPGERYRLLVHFWKSSPAGRAWQPGKQVLIRQDVAELTRLLETPDQEPIARICAANWLAEAFPNSCPEPLVRVAGSLRKGRLLETCLELLLARQGTGLEEHALSLLEDVKVPAQVRGLAGLYLGVRRYKPGRAALVRSARDANDTIARCAIHGLGAYGEGAAEALLKLLATAPPVRAPLITEELLHTQARTPAILGGLQKQADAGNEAAFFVLVKSCYPETFAYFQERAGKEKEARWKGLLAWGLINSGGEKALPVVLKMVEEDDPPADDNPLGPNELVKSLREWRSAQFVLGLSKLADKGKERAAQILAGLQSVSAMFALREIVRSAGDERLQYIAVDGLSEWWAPQSVEVLVELLGKRPPSNKWILQRAIEGLGNSADPAAIPTVKSFLEHKDPDIRQAVKHALEKLPLTRRT
jgi:hypothetical protein